MHITAVSGIDLQRLLGTQIPTGDDRSYRKAWALTLDQQNYPPGRRGCLCYGLAVQQSCRGLGARECLCFFFSSAF